MYKQPLPVIVYIVNATLILCHEIDSAYWKEWELFRLPGGIEFFVTLHIVMIAFILVGLTLLLEKPAIGRWFALLLGAGGAAGGTLHLFFLARGDDRFATAFSVGLIIAFALASLVQLSITSIDMKRRGKS